MSPQLTSAFIVKLLEQWEDLDGRTRHLVKLYLQTLDHLNHIMTEFYRHKIDITAQGERKWVSNFISLGIHVLTEFKGLEVGFGREEPWKSRVVVAEEKVAKWIDKILDACEYDGRPVHLEEQ